MRIDIPRTLLENVFDVAVGSMNFASGFLDQDEVDELRAVAVLLGVDPMEATPFNKKCSYGAPHKPYSSGPRNICWACGQTVSEMPPGTDDE